MNNLVGQTILHYKIIEQVGQGGMGIVYKAKDTKLKREVAIKFLPNRISNDKEERKRFELEAQAAASLNHPNIATIYSIEETEDQIFIVMEYIDGKELKHVVETHRGSSIHINEVITYAFQIAEGIKAAHKKGIIHRDIKPQNIIITNEDKIKILDFGLAKIMHGSYVTKIGTTIGTAAYMSPEQAHGDEVDHRTDIWSFGVVLYEMLTGEHPFKGEYEQAMIYNILNEKHQDVKVHFPDIPSNVSIVINKMLEKNPVKRFQSMEEVISELKNLKISPGNILKEKNKEPYSIAVLPFADISSGRDQDYFCEGVAEEILNSLSKIRDIRVSSRTSSFQFKDNKADIREIGKRLNVTSVLEGSVRKAGKVLRINVQLTNVEDGFYLWSERYDRELEDVFAIQEDIAENVITALKGVLTIEEKQAIQIPQTIIEAYEYFLKGRQLYHGLFLLQAKELFEKAIKLDPGYAPAYAGLAYTHSWLYEWEGSRASDLLAAENNSQKALSLAPDLSESHSSRAFVLSLAKKYDEAEKEFEKAIQLNPKSFDAHYLYGRVCFARSQIEKSAELFLKASEIQQEDFQSVLLLAQSLRILGRDKNNEIVNEGIRRTRKHLEIYPDDRRALSLGATSLYDLGEKSEALNWIYKAFELYPEDAGVLINGACLFAKNGNSEKALNMLEMAVNKGFGKREWIEHDPDYELIRNEPRFKELLNRMK